MNIKSNRFSVILFFACFILILAELNLRPEIYQTVSGKVVDEKTEQGIKDVQVIIWGNLCGWNAVTDENGDFTCSDVIPGRLNVAFYPPLPYALPVSNDRFDVFVMEKGKNLHLVKKMKCGGTIKGKVYDKKSQDINIKLLHIGLKYHYGYSFPDSREVKDNGEYFIRQIKPGLHTMVLEAYNYGPRKIENIEIGECEVKEFNYEFNSDSPTKVLGIVSCNNSAVPLSNITIGLLSKESNASTLTNCDENGNFLFRDVLPGNYLVITSRNIDESGKSIGNYSDRIEKDIVVFSRKASRISLSVNCPVDNQRLLIPFFVIPIVGAKTRAVTTGLNSYILTAPTPSRPRPLLFNR